MHNHGLFLPPYLSSIDFVTLGGAIANNTAGEKTVKYGSMRQFARNLEVVLANGEVIQTERISKKELERRKGLTTFEGEIYRQLDGLIVDHWDMLMQYVASAPQVSKNAAGYALWDVKHKDRSFDLTPLFVGSQGTLGIISEAIIGLEPSALEIVDRHLLEFLQRVNPNQLKGLVEEPYPALILLAEFDDVKSGAQLKRAKKAEKLLAKAGLQFVGTQNAEEQERLWSIRHSAAAVIWHDEGGAKALPIIEDGVVPHAMFPAYLKEIYDLFDRYNLEVAVWGHAGDANLHLQPFLDLSKLGDRQKVFKIMDEYYSMVLKLGGSTSGEHNDGRLRAPFLPKVYGPEIYELFRQVKKIFDPYGTLNPGVKIDVTMRDLVPTLRQEYSMKHLADHLPRT